MQIHCKYDELVGVDALKFHPKNANVHPQDQIERLAKILNYQGWRYPIKVSRRSGYVTSGHGRILAAKHLGWGHVPVNYQDYEDDDQETADVHSDNSIASWAELDLALINTQIGDFDPGFDIDLLGIKDFTLDVAEKEFGSGEDEVPEAVTDPVVKRGELWVLGEHRLLIDDCTVKENVDRLMAGEKVDICFTSPPYNAAKESFLNGRVAGFDNKYQNHNDAMTDDEYLRLLVGSTDLALTVSDYAFVNLQLLAHNRVPLAEYWNHYKSVLKDILIWNKSQCPPNIVRGAFNTKFEFIFCFSEDSKTRGFPADWQGQYPNVVETESNAANEFADTHKAGFPVSLPVWFLSKFAFVKSVYEPFCGTGTTIIACEKTNRRCFGMEIDPHYGQVILERWQKFSGKKAVREDGVTFDSLKIE